MLEARIQSPRGSLYFAAEATTYDLEMLGLHVRDLTPRNRVGVRLEIKVDEADPLAPLITTWLRQMAATGVRIDRAR